TGPLSDETKRKMSIANKKPNSGQFKKDHQMIRTETHNKNISIAHLGKSKIWLCGDGNVNWKGGITALCEKIRKYNKYKSWRDSVYLRDDFTCLNCGKRGGDLHSHHFISFADILSNFNIST